MPRREEPSRGLLDPVAKMLRLPVDQLIRVVVEPMRCYHVIPLNVLCGKGCSSRKGCASGAVTLGARLVVADCTYVITATRCRRWAACCDR